tara:strand:+ start:548 stop:988 length:441 start_codon:yes stop_codon:yes gene_type:complete
MLQHLFIVFALSTTLFSFGVIWAEDAWSEFYRWGPPFQVGSIVIETWAEYIAFVGLLVLYQITRVYVEETSGRAFEKAHIQGQQFGQTDIVFMSLYNFYTWLGTILHILVAVTRLDVWCALALVDTLMRALLWSPTPGRRPRAFRF